MPLPTLFSLLVAWNEAVMVNLQQLYCDHMEKLIYLSVLGPDNVLLLNPCWQLSSMTYYKLKKKLFLVSIIMATILSGK